MDQSPPRSPASIALTALVVAAAAVGGAGVVGAVDGVADGSVSPATVDAGATVDHTATVVVENVSADGDEDVLYVAFPDDADVSPNGVSVEDADTGDGVAVSSSPELVDGPDGDGVADTVRFAVQPDGGGTVDLRVNVSASVGWPADAGAEYPLRVVANDSDGTSVGPTAFATVTAEDPREVTFDQFGYDVDVGEDAEVTVELENTDTAALAVTSSNPSFSANLTLTDADGDGAVTVRVDTAAVGGDGAFAAGEGDELTVDDATSFEEPGVGATELSLTATAGDATATRTVLVREPVDRSTVTATPTPTPGETPAGETPSATPTTSPGLGPLVGVAALAAAALLARRR